jgi:hypothetical protein
MMTRLRFDILIENTIRALPRGSDQLIPLKVADPVAKRTVKTIVRFLLRPLKPIIRPVARYGRRYLVGDIEASLDVLRAQMLSLSRNQSRQLQNALELVQLLHTKADDLGLRSRGLVQIDASTFALRTYDGFVFIPRADNLLLLMLLDAGPAGLEPGTRRILTKLLQPGMTFVDIGAHIGLLTLAGARAVGRTGKVLALEPTPAAFDSSMSDVFLAIVH